MLLIHFSIRRQEEVFVSEKNTKKKFSSHIDFQFSLSLETLLRIVWKIPLNMRWVTFGRNLLFAFYNYCYNSFNVSGREIKVKCRPEWKLIALAIWLTFLHEKKEWNLKVLNDFLLVFMLPTIAHTKKVMKNFIDISLSFFWDFYESLFYVKITSEVQHKKWIYSSSVCPVI